MSITDDFNQSYQDVFGNGVPSIPNAVTTDNTGTNLDLSAGVNGGVPANAPIGNSLIDSLNQISSLAGSIVNTGLQAYTSFLNSKAVSNAAQRLGTTPTAVTGAINTVPLTPTQQANKTMLYVGIAAVVGVILYKVARRR